MHAFINRATLAAAASLAAAVAPTRTTNPHLGHVHLQAVGDRLILTATDMLQSIQATETAAIEAEGLCTVSAASLAQIVSSLTDGTVELKLTSKGLGISGGGARFSLASTDGSEYPPLPGGAGEDRVVLDVAGEALALVIADTVASISTDEGRDGLTGALLELDDADGKSYAVGSVPAFLRLVSTDGTRLAMSECSVTTLDGHRAQDTDGGEVARRMTSRELLLSRDGLGQLARAIGKGQVWRLIISDRAIVATTETDGSGLRLVLRTVSGTFPPYRAIMPGDSDMKGRATVNRPALASAIKRCAIMAEDRAQTGIFDLSEADATGEMAVSAHSATSGDARDRVPVDLEGTGIRLGMSLRLLSDAVSRVQGERCTLETGDPLSPVIVRDISRQSAMWLVMPMRID